MSFGELITNIQKQNLACVAELPQTPHFCILLPHVALWINKLEVNVRQIIALAVLLESGLIEGHRRLATFCFFIRNTYLHWSPGGHEMRKWASWFDCQSLDLRQTLLTESASDKLLELEWHLRCLDKEAIKIFCICLHWKISYTELSSLKNWCFWLHKYSAA